MKRLIKQWLQLILLCLLNCVPVFCMNNGGTRPLNAADVCHLMRYIDTADQPDTVLQFTNKLQVITTPMAREQYNSLMETINNHLNQRKSVQNTLKKYTMYGVISGTAVTLYGLLTLGILGWENAVESNMPKECTDIIADSAPHRLERLSTLTNSFTFTLGGGCFGAVCWSAYRQFSAQNKPIIQKLELMKQALETHQNPQRRS